MAHQDRLHKKEEASPSDYMGNSLQVGRNSFKDKKDKIMPIDKPYAYHKPSEEGLNKITRLREVFSEVERTIKEICPDSRQRAVALTNNETTAMWAIKSVVFNDPESEVEGMASDEFPTPEPLGEN